MIRNSRTLVLFFFLFFFSVRLSPLFAQSLLETDVLVVGSSQSAWAAAVQAARNGSNVVLATEGDSLGGSSIQAGVSAIDGNELEAFQSGIWGEFLWRLSLLEKNLLQYGWVSLFTFNPVLGQTVIENWLKEEQKIKHIKELYAKKVIFSEEKTRVRKVKGVEFSNGLKILAKVTIDATELGDLLALGEIPHRLGWEYQGEFDEPSAPKKKSWLTKHYPVQELSWVFFLKDYQAEQAPLIQKPVGYSYRKAAQRYWCAFKNKKLLSQSNFFNNWGAKYAQREKKGQRFFSPETFLTYGQISPEFFMINWPICGNDYGRKIERLFQEQNKALFLREAHTHALWFARYLQDTFGRRFGLASEIFPASPENYQTAGFGLIPYFREARRLIGLETLTEENLSSYSSQSVAVGNYPNDHHYFELAPKNSDRYYKPITRSIRWGGRNTGKPFGISFKSLIPVRTDGLLVAEKSWSVSHVANGSTRLQPVCLQIGQAVGSIAALSVKNQLQPAELKISDIQASLLNDSFSPPILVPLFDLKVDNPYRGAIQRLILSGVIEFPKDHNFYPERVISWKEFKKWSQKAKVKIFSEKEFPVGLQRDKAAYLIESKALSLSEIPLKKSVKQAQPNFQAKTYCGKLGKKGKNFFLESLSTQNKQSVYRKTPLVQKKRKVNKAGIVTTNPKIYQFLLSLSAKERREVCLRGVLNNSAAWITFLALEK